MPSLTATRPLLISVAAIGALLFVAAPRAFAQPPIIESARQELESAVKDAESSADPAARAEAKQEAFLKIIRFSKLEGENLIAAIVAMDERDFDETLAARLALLKRRIEAARDHFTRIEETIMEAPEPFALSAIETIAEAFRDWRAKTYDPLIREAMEVRLMIQARDALDIAEHRFSKIAAAVEGLNADQLKNVLAPFLDRAEQHLQNSKLIVREVERLSQDQSASLAPSAQASSRSRSGQVVQELLAQAIGQLKSAYSAFMDMNVVIQSAKEKDRGSSK